MKAIELRMGNIALNSSNEAVTVRQISNTLVRTTPDDIHLISELKPIPLTEDILLKCGFETSQWDCHSTFRKNICSDGCIVISLEHKHVEIGDLTLDIEIKYLHQLQNMFYCLCGKELEINL